MLAAINTNSLKHYTIDNWLNSNAHNSDAPLRTETEDVFSDVCTFKHYYRIFDEYEYGLFEQIQDDLWSKVGAKESLNRIFPFYIVDTRTKKVVKKVGFKFQYDIGMETIE